MPTNGCAIAKTLVAVRSRKVIHCALRRRGCAGILRVAKASKPGRGASATRAAGDGARAGRVDRAAGSSPPRSGRNLPVAGTARSRRFRSGGHAARDAARRHSLGTAVARMPCDAVDAYVKRHRLRHIEDESNADPRFARSRLRTQVWPALSKAFPGAERSLAIAANWAQQARLAMRGAGSHRSARGHSAAGTRYHGMAGAVRPSAQCRVARMARDADRCRAASIADPALMNEVDRPGAATWSLRRTARGKLRRYRGWLRVVDAPSAARGPAAGTAQALRVSRAGLYRIDGWEGLLRVQRVPTQGVALARLRRGHGPCTRGGRAISAATNRPPRALKKQYQSLGIEPTSVRARCSISTGSCSSRQGSASMPGPGRRRVSRK